MNEFDGDGNQARIQRALANSLADYTPPANGELHLPVFDELDTAHSSAANSSAPLQTALPMDTPVPPVQDAFDGWSTSYEQVDSGIKAERDDFHARPQPSGDIDSSFDITRVFSATGAKIQRQSQEWGNATVAVFAARKEQHNLIWLGLAALIAIVALVWLFKPASGANHAEQIISLDPQATAPDLSMAPPPSAPVQAVAPVPTGNSVAAAPVVQSAPAPAAPAASTAAAAPVAKPVATAPVVDRYQAAKPVAKPAAASSSAVKGGYTVQIAAAHNEANVKSLAAKLPKPSEAQIVRSWRDGKPWYVLSYGHFKHRDDAARARDALPALVKKGNAPWVKEL